MGRSYSLWKANAITFSSSFCVMVIELVASRLLAPYIGMSLYTWASIIGVIMAGIAAGNYIGGKIADRHASPPMLAAIFFAGALATLLILPISKTVAYGNWFSAMPLMAGFTLKVSCIFLLPAIVLSMVSPIVIKLTLENLGRTGSTVGTIYAFSTAGSILGTFMTGFYFIAWSGTRNSIWIVAGLLMLIGTGAWLVWRQPGRVKIGTTAVPALTFALAVALLGSWLGLSPKSWQELYTAESNYFSIRIWDTPDGYRGLGLDHMTHAMVNIKDPTDIKYNYVKIFREVLEYTNAGKPPPAVLHLGGGGYSFSRYVEAAYRGSANDVVEIDPAVTKVAFEYLGLPAQTGIRTYNQDARIFLAQREAVTKYDAVVADVFNDCSIPYQLTTLEFNEMLKTHMAKDGVYMLNVIDDYQKGRFLPSMIFTLKQTFNNVYLLGSNPWEYVGIATFIIVATDRRIDLADFERSTTTGGRDGTSVTLNEARLASYLTQREPLLLTDDYAPTDILVAWLQQGR